MATGISRTHRSIIAATAALVAVPAQAGGVLAGSLIENTARATYTSNSTTQTVDSNTVTLKVDELLDVAAASQESGPVAATTTAVLRFKITNTGNGGEAFTLVANPSVSGNAFDATIDGLAIDTNNNGIYDAGIDTDLTNGANTASLPADGPLNVLVRVSIPAGAAPAATSKVELTATAVTGSGAPGTVFAGAGLGGGDAVVGTSTALQTAQATLTANRVTVALAKSATVADPFGGARPVPNAIVTYRIVANVTGTGSVSGLAVTDAIPTGTTYQPGTLTLEGAAITDGADGDAGQASAGGIAVQLGTVGAGAQRTVTFKVKIN